MRYLSVVAFVPVHHVDDVFQTLCHADIISDEATNVLNYFEDTWTECVARRLIHFKLIACYKFSEFNFRAISFTAVNFRIKGGSTVRKRYKTCENMKEK